ncbi:hypothetical protein [Sulfitobacter sp. NFXS29]|uniref:hypothetical protein n=1 Tax=Sulfitobacter sp. NFXS29 TaxID=2818438 RepID=UPI0032DECCD5
MPRQFHKTISIICLMAPGGVFAQTAEQTTTAPREMDQNTSASEWSVEVGISPKFYYRLNEGPGAAESAEIEAFAEIAYGPTYFHALALSLDDPRDDAQVELTLGHRGDLTEKLAYDAYYTRFLRDETGDVRGELHGRFDYSVSEPWRATVDLGVEPERGDWVYKLEAGYTFNNRIDAYAFVEQDDILDYTGYEIGANYDLDEGNAPLDASLLSYVNHTEGGETIFAVEMTLSRFLLGD